MKFFKKPKSTLDLLSPNLLSHSLKGALALGHARAATPEAAPAARGRAAREAGRVADVEEVQKPNFDCFIYILFPHGK